MSVMSALPGRVGSTSPKARAVIFSYAPTVPNVMPPNVGDSSRTTWSCVMRASASDASDSALANTVTTKPKPIGVGLTLQEFLLLNIFSSVTHCEIHSIGSLLQNSDLLDARHIDQRKHSIHHFARLAQVIRGVTQARELLAVQMPIDFRMVSQKIKER